MECRRGACKLVHIVVNIQLHLPSNFPLLTSNELFDFLDEFRDIWLWLGLLSVLFFSITSWQLYEVCCIVNIGWTLPWSPQNGWNTREDIAKWVVEWPNEWWSFLIYRGSDSPFTILAKQRLMDVRGGTLRFWPLLSPISINQMHKHG